MKIEFNESFNSVGAFTWDNLPSLSIITGLNGAGKSQLFEAYKPLKYAARMSPTSRYF